MAQLITNFVMHPPRDHSIKVEFHSASGEAIHRIWINIDELYRHSDTLSADLINTNAFYLYKGMFVNIFVKNIDNNLFAIVINEYEHTISKNVLKTVLDAFKDPFGDSDVGRYS